MKRLLVAIVVGPLLALCLAGVAESQCVPGPNGTCVVPQQQAQAGPILSKWRAATGRTGGAPIGGRVVPLVPIIRPVQPKQPPQINVQPATPQINVQSDPAVGQALQQIAVNTAPPLEPEQPPEPEKQMTPLLAGLVILGSVVAGLFLFFKTQSH